MFPKEEGPIFKIFFLSKNIEPRGDVIDHKQTSKFKISFLTIRHYELKIFSYPQKDIRNNQLENKYKTKHSDSKISRNSDYR